jgi:hypothetical protein
MSKDVKKVGHTSGEWTVSETWPEENSVIKVKKNVLGVKDGTGRTIALCGYTSHSEAKANARLIAAAPELLEQCHRLLNILDCPGSLRKTYKHCIDTSKAIIARAEGK